MLISIITFIAFLSIVLYIMVDKWLISNEFSDGDFIVLIAAIVLIASVIHYKNKAESYERPCPEYKKIEVYIPK